MHPPFDKEAFDIVVSNGVIHHTPSTEKTFIQVANVVKNGGLFYLWLYRRPEGFAKRLLIFPLVDLLRSVISRLPALAQRYAVVLYAFALLGLHKITGQYKDRHKSFHERIVLAFDTLTPLWKHYHTPYELASWFFKNGFESPILTHWDNPHGFGMVATKNRQENTAGVNFGKLNVSRGSLG